MNWITGLDRAIQRFGDMSLSTYIVLIVPYYKRLNQITQGKRLIRKVYGKGHVRISKGEEYMRGLYRNS